MEESGQQKQKRGMRVLVIVVAVVLILAVIAVALDWQRARQVLAQANWQLIVPALLFTAISYLFLGAGFAIVCRAFGFPVGWWDLWQVGFVTNVLNILVAAGGFAGVSVSLLALRRRQVPTEDILAASLFSSYIDGLVLLVLLPGGLLYLLVRHPLSTGATVGVALVAVILVLLLAGASWLIFSARVRTVLLELVGRLWKRVTRRAVGKVLDDLDRAMGRGVEGLRQRPLLVVLLIVAVTVDWSACLVALWFCFDALGKAPHPGVLITGFAVGAAAGLLSFVPGGLGVQEGSMAGIYALLGVPLGQAVLASVLFRVVYYFVPFGVSLAFYWRLLKGKVRSAEGAEGTE